MNSAAPSQHLTEASNQLKPIYDKVQQLVRMKQMVRKQEAKKQYVTVIEPLRRTQLVMGISKNEQFITKRLNINNQNRQNQPGRGRLSPAQTDRRLTSSTPSQTLTKPQRLLNFLKAHKTTRCSSESRLPTPGFAHSPQQSPADSERYEQKSVQASRRPVSRTSRNPESVTGTQFTRLSSSQNRSSGGYSQTARLAQVSNTPAPSKYLRKGHRMRETLLRQLQTPHDIEEEQEMVYMKEYDQWVPASLASYKRKELEKFLNILIGEKKSDNKQAVIFQPLYL